MKIVFYGTKPYDKIWFEKMAVDYGYELHFVEESCNEETVKLADGCDAVCVFVNDDMNKNIIDALYEMGVKGILLRCAGFNNVDLKAAEGKLVVLRVPSYSPEAVAEFAMALLLTVNRYTHKAYVRTREFNMRINGLMGCDLHGKTAGVVGTGKIGQSMINIFKGFGMEVLAYDPFPNNSLDVTYVDKDELFKRSDVITLHCPLTNDTKHMINKESIALMKDDVYLVNTSRGSLINTEDLIEALLNKKFSGVGLDVYEEEEGVFYEDHSDKIIQDENLVRLSTFPNVLITSHMGFFTKEAMQQIASVTLENAYALENGLELKNRVVL